MTAAIAYAEDKIASTKGINLFVRSWQPAAPRAVLVIAHGFNSHSGQYQWVAEQLAAQGFAVFVGDLRGRGKSDGERFHVESYNDYVDDIGSVMAQAMLRVPGLPVFLLGHSAGGVAACLYALDHQAHLAGLICESFAFKLPAPDVALAVLKGISHVLPHAHVLALKNKDFSRDPAVVKAMDEDPLIAHESESAETAAELARAGERLGRAFGKITLPLLILHGTADAATVPAGSQQFHDQAGSSDRTLKLYPGHFHDLLNDLGKEQVLADIQSWMDRQLSELT